MTTSSNLCRQEMPWLYSDKYEVINTVINNYIKVGLHEHYLSSVLN